uniref:Integrase, catalytic region, zinc finger, CCHC-type, peptidase aspartic, catalytic n=1 Tax=Tanacetum cinerariifolium TaxID=118510 RepID=A0A6L2P504_TANCI|nr:hypothetical protein [Tanacetum cinerariifolium]
MHNNIMSAGSRDRPSMLVTERYAQWQSRFLRYIDTRPNGDALRKCILKGLYQPTTVTIIVVAATENSLAIPERTAVETILTMSPKNKAHYESEKEAIHLLLTGIGDEFYSTVDAYKRTYEMWIAIERLQQEWTRFVTIVKQQHDLDTVLYHKLFDVLKQYQKEVNEIHAGRIAKNANPLALVVVASPYADPYYQSTKISQTIYMLAPKGLTFNEPVDQAWEKHSHNHFRAPTALDMEVLIKTCLMPLAIKTRTDSFAFVRELKQEMHDDLKYVESFESEIDELESDKAEFSNMYDILFQEFTTQILPRRERQAVRNTNVIKPGMYRIDTRTTQPRAPQLPRTYRNTNPHVSTSTEVNYSANISRL